jgi:hypothetical protein
MAGGAICLAAVLQVLTKDGILAGKDSVRLFLKPFERASPYSAVIRSTGHRS